MIIIYHIIIYLGFSLRFAHDEHGSPVGVTGVATVMYYDIIKCTGRTGVYARIYVTHYFIPSRRKVCAAVVMGESAARMKFRVVSYLI